KRYITLKF
ncbi:hypothetical protein TNCV_2791711, partial [Trichonephila clavipes]